MIRRSGRGRSLRCPGRNRRSLGQGIHCSRRIFRSLLSVVSFVRVSLVQRPSLVLGFSLVQGSFSVLGSFSVRGSSWVRRGEYWYCYVGLLHLLLSWLLSVDSKQVSMYLQNL